MKEQKVTDKKEVAQKKNSKKKEFFLKRWGKKIKEVFAEIKKVSWPSFSKVVKQTGVVIGVVLLFAIVITLIDFGLSNLFDLLGKIGG
ncbi:MAG: preprotein translocase subunit SecE [Clostridia bacterium]|nr:preprotein translocase subunit SecE [Clostridia bacterium]